jgi:hypothetical protein
MPAAGRLTPYPFNRGKPEKAEYIPTKTNKGQEQPPFNELVLLFFKIFSEKNG